MIKPTHKRTAVQVFRFHHSNKILTYLFLTSQGHYWPLSRVNFSHDFFFKATFLCRLGGPFSGLLHPQPAWLDGEDHLVLCQELNDNYNLKIFKIFKFFFGELDILFASLCIEHSYLNRNSVKRHKNFISIIYYYYKIKFDPVPRAR